MFSNFICNYTIYSLRPLCFFTFLLEDKRDIYLRSLYFLTFLLEDKRDIYIVYIYMYIICKGVEKPKIFINSRKIEIK